VPALLSLSRIDPSSDICSSLPLWLGFTGQTKKSRGPACGFDLVVVRDRSATVHKNTACAPRGPALRLRHQLRDQKGTATASRNKVTSEISTIPRRTSLGAHRLAVNVRAHHRKRAQIFDPLPDDAAIKNSPSQWAASAISRQALLSPRPRGASSCERKARSFPKSIPRRFNSSAAREQTGQIAPQRRTGSMARLSLVRFHPARLRGPSGRKSVLGSNEQKFGAKQQIPKEARYGQQLERRPNRAALAVQSSPANEFLHRPQRELSSGACASPLSIISMLRVHPASTEPRA
jgi:hypothetical protein